MWDLIKDTDKGSADIPVEVYPTTRRKGTQTLCNVLTRFLKLSVSLVQSETLDIDISFACNK